MLFALGSVAVERRGPEQVTYGNLCGPATRDPCDQPALKGGFPFAFLVDTPGVSREHQLSFFEDTWQPLNFVLDVAMYCIAIVALMAIRQRRLLRPRSG